VQEGRILVGGVDCRQLELKGQRASLSIIPQEPFMFTGSLRDNLDPFGVHDDATLEALLEDVGLTDQMEAVGGLRGAVAGSGADCWSVGQMQLVCLARASLNNVPIVCMDEATAALDPHTEKHVLVRRAPARCVRRLCSAPAWRAGMHACLRSQLSALHGAAAARTGGAACRRCCWYGPALHHRARQIRAILSLGGASGMQAVARRLFAERTVLTIAHRLDTVIECDTVVVMEVGTIAETGPVCELLQNPTSWFSRLVDMAGPEEAASLRAMAETHRDGGIAHSA
jgi:ABC-type methionine transport system ATPase subunit